ncbi:MAG: choloylglycine hydrolase [Methanosphaera sp. rholeuAM130]|nr:MAG: choloylglycine hydrolase [Methanosphaera sp. rholeuAM130]
MCTAASFLAEDHYFGRNLDLEYSYNETVVITPREYEFKFKQVDNIKSHHAIIGMAFVVDNYPLYYDACNEKGLAMAGLNFPSAVYRDSNEEKDNIASFEFIPWILSQCETVADAIELIEKINILNINFSEKLPATGLHWMISDKKNSIVVESNQKGIMIYFNPLGVMTNEPSFDKQAFNIKNYRHLSNKTPENTFSPNLELEVYSRGMGTMGLPGGLDSASRFVKVAFTLQNALKGEDEEENVNQFFHILGSVYQQKGCCEVAEGKYEYTIYSSCMNTDKGIYYYKTYENTQINAINMYNCDLTDDELVVYPLNDSPAINYQNGNDEEVMYN